MYEYSKPNYLNSQDCISTIVIHNGNLHLAAEKIDRARKLQAPNDPPVTPADIVRVLTNDPTALADLQAQMRTYALIKTLETTGKLHDSMSDAIGAMESADIAKTYVALLRSIGEYTDNHTSTQNVNVREMILHQLPKEIAEAFEILSPPDAPRLTSGYMMAQEDDD